MTFVLNGCNISFVAAAAEDITLKQLIQQCDKIYPDWCACGICSLDYCKLSENTKTEIIIHYNSVRKLDDGVPCTIRDVVHSIGG